MGSSNNTVTRFARPSIFWVTTTVVAALISYFRILPFDTYAIPLDCVTTTQLFVLGYWLVYCSRSWSSRFLFPSVLIVFNSCLEWTAMGMPIPANLMLLTIGPLVKLVTLTMLVLSLLALKNPTNVSQIGPPRFSIADLLWLAAMIAVAIFLVLQSLPDPKRYQYLNEVGHNPWLIRTISALLRVVFTLIIFRIRHLRVLRIPLLSSTIVVALAAGLLIARFLGIVGNPTWGNFVFGPSSIALLSAIAISVNSCDSKRLEVSDRKFFA